MITSKAEFSQTAQAIHTVIQATNQPVKLGSIREAIAHALKYKTANGLLSDLPIEIPDFFYDSLSQQLLEQHRIKWRKPSYSFPWPEGMTLTSEEINIVWLDACANNDFFGRINENLSSVEALKGFRPNGRGGWFYSGNLPPLSEVVFTDTRKDPNTLFCKKLITSKLVAEISTNIAPLCINYWDEHQKFFIREVFSKLASSPLKDSDNKAVDLSELLDINAKDIFTTQANFSSDGINPFSPNINPFVPVSLDISKKSIGLTDQIPHRLIDRIRGECLFNEMMNFDYESLFWEPLQRTCSCPDEFSSEKREFYNPFIYSDEFYQAIERLAMSWLVIQPDWSTSLRNLITTKWYSPEDQRESILSTEHQTEDVNELMLPKEHKLSFTTRSYCRGDNPFYEADDDDEFDEEPFSFDFDLESFQKELMDDEEFVEDYGVNGKVSSDQLEAITQEAKAEAEAEAREVYYEEKSNAPFVEPFIIESLGIAQTNSNSKNEMEIVGDLFVDLFCISTLGVHWTLMDEMSANFSTLSWFIKENTSFFESYGGEGDKTLFYITDFVLTTDTSYDDIAIAVAHYFITYGGFHGGFEGAFVVLHPDVLERCYPAGPYHSISELAVEFEQAKQMLVQSFEAQGLACAFI